MQNKKGEISIGIIVAIIVGVVVLVFLIIGFRSQWNIFQGRTGVYVGSVNVDDMRNFCYISCMNEAEYDYCSAKKALEIEGGKKGSFTCKDMEEGIYTDKENSKDKLHVGRALCEEGPSAINKKAEEEDREKDIVIFKCEQVVSSFEECSRIVC